MGLLSGVSRSGSHSPVEASWRTTAAVLKLVHGQFLVTFCLFIPSIVLVPTEGVLGCWTLLMTADLQGDADSQYTIVFGQRTARLSG